MNFVYIIALRTKVVILFLTVNFIIPLIRECKEYLVLFPSSGPRCAVHKRSWCRWEEHSWRKGHYGVPEGPRQLSRVHPLWTSTTQLQREADAGLDVPLVSFLLGGQSGLYPLLASRTHLRCFPIQVVCHRLPVVSWSGQFRDWDAGNRRLQAALLPDTHRSVNM